MVNASKQIQLDPIKMEGAVSETKKYFFRPIQSIKRWRDKQYIIRQIGNIRLVRQEHKDDQQSLRALINGLSRFLMSTGLLLYVIYLV